MQAFEIEEGKTFRFRNEVYRVETSDKQEEGMTGNDYIPVTRLASLWPCSVNPWLSKDTWIPTSSTFIENFNPYADVTLVHFRIICEVTEIKKPSIIPAVEAASNPTGK